MSTSTITTKSTSTNAETAAIPDVAADGSGGEAAGVQLLELAPSKVFPHPRNPRLKITDLEGLTESVRQVGVIQPIVVAPWPADLPTSSRARQDGHVIIMGHRRHAAAKAAKRKVRAIVRPDLDTVAKQVEAMIHENKHRSDLSAIEEGDAYQTLLGLDLSQAEISEHTGVAKRTVSERVRLAKLPEAAREKVHARQITLEAGLTLAEFADDPAVQAKLMQSLGTYGFDGEVRAARDDRRAARDRVKEHRSLTQQGVTVLDAYPESLVPGDGERDLPGYMTLGDLVEAPGLPAVLRKAYDLDDAGDVDWDMTVIWHRDGCSGHAVVDTGTRPHAYGHYGPLGDFEFVPICTTPSAHEDLWLTPDQGSDTGADLGTRGEVGVRAHVRGGAQDDDDTPPDGGLVAAAIAQGLEEAARSRRAHVAAVLAVEAACDVWVRQVHYDRTQTALTERIQGPREQENAAALRAMLGMPTAATAEAASMLTETECEQVLDRVAEAPLAEAIAVAVAVEEARTEGWITSTSDLQPHIARGFSARWLASLAASGYQWTDFERDHIPDWLRDLSDANRIDAPRPGPAGDTAPVEVEGGEVA